MGGLEEVGWPPAQTAPQDVAQALVDCALDHGTAAEIVVCVMMVVDHCWPGPARQRRLVSAVVAVVAVFGKLPVAVATLGLHPHWWKLRPLLHLLQLAAVVAVVAVFGKLPVAVATLGLHPHWWKPRPLLQLAAVAVFCKLPVAVATLGLRLHWWKPRPLLHLLQLAAVAVFCKLPVAEALLGLHLHWWRLRPLLHLLQLAAVAVSVACMSCCIFCSSIAFL